MKIKNMLIVVAIVACSSCRADSSTDVQQEKVLSNSWNGSPAEVHHHELHSGTDQNCPKCKKFATRHRQIPHIRLVRGCFCHQVFTSQTLSLFIQVDKIMARTFALNEVDGSPSAATSSRIPNQVLLLSDVKSAKETSRSIAEIAQSLGPPDCETPLLGEDFDLMSDYKKELRTVFFKDGKCKAIMQWKTFSQPKE